MTTLDEAAIALAETLPVDVVPAKLRCGSCNKLAIDALKLPCCAQSICQPCSVTLPETCPICSHSPVSGEDCTPIKSLRLSVKAFLKNEHKKRNKDVEATVAPPADTPAGPAAPADSLADGAPVDGTVEVMKDDINGEVGAVLDAQPSEYQDTVQQSVVDVEGEQEEEEDDDDDVIITTERPEQEVEQQEQHAEDGVHDHTDQGQGMEQSFGNGDGNMNGNFGFDQNPQGFGGMDFSNMNGFNPMMMMQNGMGMPNFDMGMQNMMGMPGMNMDPSMMFNGGFGGMGGMNDMSMMNMGMGMGNMSGFGGMPGMGMGGGPGFFPGNGGYNQQSFGNNMHQNQNFHHNRGYGGRPYGRGFRGRGWGGYNRGRGNWQNNGGHFQGNQNYMNQQGYQQQQSFQGGDDTSFGGQEQPKRRGSPSYEPMNGVENNDVNKDSAQTTAGDSGISNQADVDATNQTGDSGGDAETTNDNGAELEATNGETNQGKHDLGERSPARINAQSLVGRKEYAEAAIEDVMNDASIKNTSTEPVTTGANTESGAEHILHVSEEQESHTAVQGGPQDQYYDQQYQQGFGYGPRGRGGFRGGRGGFRGRGGAYGYFSTPGEAQMAPAPPINAPTGPKALREGKPNSGIYSRPQPPPAPQASSTVAVRSDQTPARDERGRSRSRSRPRSEREYAEEKERSGDHRAESEEARHEKRRRRDDEYESERYGDVNGDKSSHKGRSRSETPEDDKSRRRHRDDERRDSRSHRDRSRDKHRRRHRSRSLERESSGRDDDANGSRRKSKSDRRRESRHDESEYYKDKERSSKSSRREDDYERRQKDRSNNSSKHRRSGRDERDRDRDREHRPVLEEPQDEIGFKIKGSKSASLQAEAEGKSMAPPTTFGRDRDSRRQSASGTPNTPAGDPYAEEREKRQRERLDRENTLRRQSTQSLGKRTSREDEELEAPMGPKSDTGRGVKKARRKVSYKYEDEVGDGYEERDSRRWR